MTPRTVETLTSAATANRTGRGIAPPARMGTDCMDPAPCTPTKLADGFGSKSLPVRTPLNPGFTPVLLGPPLPSREFGVRDFVCRGATYETKASLSRAGDEKLTKRPKINDVPHRAMRTMLREHARVIAIFLAAYHVRHAHGSGLPGRQRGASMGHGRLEPSRPRDQPLPAPARAQSGRLVPVG